MIESEGKSHSLKHFQRSSLRPQFVFQNIKASGGKPHLGYASAIPCALAFTTKSTHFEKRAAVPCSVKHPVGGARSGLLCSPATSSCGLSVAEAHQPLLSGSPLHRRALRFVSHFLHPPAPSGRVIPRQKDAPPLV